jgi:hypothetical protein
MAFPERKEDDKGSAATLRWATRALVSMVWISAAIFGLYIIAFYAGVAFDGAIDQWNAALPRLYEPDTPFATIGIGAHFAAGAIVLVLGPIQLIGAVRARAPGSTAGPDASMCSRRWHPGWEDSRSLQSRERSAARG